MAKQTLSLELRKRVGAAVSNGMSLRQAAGRFEVSAASAIRWCARERETRSAASKPKGGDRLSARIEAQTNLILALVNETCDIKLPVCTIFTACRTQNPCAG